MATPAVSPDGLLSPSARRTERLLEATYAAEQRHFWFSGLRRFVRPLLEEASEKRRDLRLLDCGCGTGANLGMLGEFGQPFGFDLSEAGPRFARRYGQTRLAQASITSIPHPTNCFDVVTAFDVLVTLGPDDARTALDEMFRVLKPNGTLIVNTAALDFLRGTHSFRSNEVQRTSRAQLGRMLQQAGFVVERLTYTNFSLFPLVLAVRLAQRVVGSHASKDTGIEMRVPPAFINGPLTALLTIESRLLRVMNMPIGSSLLAAARKPR